MARACHPRSYRTDPPPPITDRLVLSDEEWQRRLTRDQYDILRRQRTEPSFSCELWQEHRAGTFYCGGCGNPLFSSRHKFESGTGWASFYQPIESGRVSEHSDVSHGMIRTEVRCARCDGHLGHVFDDGPAPTGLRYCINGSILEFVPQLRTGAPNLSGAAPWRRVVCWGPSRIVRRGR